MAKKEESTKEPQKTRFFLFKIIALIFISYLLVQLSNEARRTEEKENMPSLQTTYDLAEKYVKKRYMNDWAKLGHRLYAPDRFAEANTLDMETSVGILKIIKIENSSFFIISIYEKNDQVYNVNAKYDNNLDIEVGFVEDEDYISYDIAYEDGSYLRNSEMEQQTGITTREAVEWAENIRKMFEEELWRMHDYQIDKARKIRGRLTDFGAIVLVVMVIIKWSVAGKRMRKETGTTEQCIDETVAYMPGRSKCSRKWGYVILGMGVTFWIYILRPVISNYLLSGLDGMLKVYGAYGISAVITAIAAYLLIRRMKSDDSENGEENVRVSKPKAVLQTATGCLVMVTGIILLNSIIKC